MNTTARSLLTTIALFSLALNSYSRFGMASDDVMRVEMLSESPRGVRLAIEFAAAELKLFDKGGENERLLIDMNGAVPDLDRPGPALPVITKLIAVPNGCSARARIVSSEEIRIEAGPLSPRDEMGLRELRRIDPPPTVEAGAPGWMRWMHVAPVVIRPARFDEGGNVIAVTSRLEVEFEFVPGGSELIDAPDPAKYWSPAFQEFFDAMLLYHDRPNHIRVGGQVIRRGSYVIISDSTAAQRIQEFAEWKRRKGFDVVFAPIYRAGMTADEIRQYLRDAYLNWERPPEFVLLLGDVNAPNMNLPTFYIRNPRDPRENDVTDAPYTFVTGNDYFPDLFIGRISTNKPVGTDATIALNRVLNHERYPLDFEDLGAYHRATAFAGNFGDGNLPVLSPVETAEWARFRLEELGYDVDFFPYRDENDDINPGPIVESINRGVNIVLYRGWADARGTHYPQFYKENLEQLDNGPLLPLATFFVCNVGDFGSERQVPWAFGEYSITRGTRNNPTGFLVFLGPSDLHTSTIYNNAMLAGFYNALLYHDVRVIGALTLASKMEVWRSFPERRRGGDDVEFYFHVYNILGDPEVNFYLHAPDRLAVIHVDTIAVGATTARFEVTREGRTAVEGSIITLRKPGETVVSALTDQSGEALIPVNLASEGALEVTVTAHQAAPYMAALPVVQRGAMVGFAEVEVSDPFGGSSLVTGATVDLLVSLRNAGSNIAAGVVADISGGEFAEIISGHAAFGDIAAGAATAANEPFRVLVNANFPDGGDVPFGLEISDDDGNIYDGLFRLTATGTGLRLVSSELAEGVVQPGGSSDLILTVNLDGGTGAGGLYAELHSHDEAVVVNDGYAAFGDVAAGESADCADDPFRISIPEGVTVGRRIILRVAFMDGNDRNVGNRMFAITVGQVGPTTPLGPDRYGYYGYDNGDEGAFEAPSFDWIELDPAHGGEGGTHHRMDDDASLMIDLPFDFQYYGESYNRVTLCSNGWIAFDEYWGMFRNWPIPSPLGPHAMIAPYWEDLVGEMIDNVRDSLNVFTAYDREAGAFIVEWSRARARSGVADHVETFEVILYDPAVRATPTGDGEIIFQYLDLEMVDRNEGNYATVGIQDWNHTDGLEATYGGRYAPAAARLGPERVIKFTTVPPDRFNKVASDAADIPVEFALQAPWPNPFNARTTVEFSVAQPGMVKLQVWDLSGRMVRELLNAPISAGRRQINFDAGDMTNGLYLLRIEAAGKTAQRKMILIK